MSAGPHRPERTAAGWFLGLGAVALMALLWLRGMGRLLLPVLLVVALGALVVKFVRAVLRPLP